MLRLTLLLFFFGVDCCTSMPFRGHLSDPEVTNQIIDLAQLNIQKWMADIRLSYLEHCRYLFILMNTSWYWYLLILDLKEWCFDCYNSMWSFNVLDDANKYVCNINWYFVLLLFVTTSISNILCFLPYMCSNVHAFFVVRMSRIQYF